jgi:hypothetical protein
MRFREFLRVTVLVSAAAATLLAVLTVVGANQQDDTQIATVGVVWWAIAAVVGVWIGRRHTVSGQIGSLLADARSTNSLPEMNPARTFINRLWPLLACTIGAGVVSLQWPQVSAVAAGFAIIWSLAWRHQAAAVTAIEGRDGSRFYVDRTSPFRAIKLVRAPGLRSNLAEMNGAQRPVGARQAR